MTKETTTVKTKDYTFSINLTEGGKRSDFEIVAVLNSNKKRRSCITSMNFIIGAIVEDIAPKEDYEGSIDVTEKQGKKLYAYAIESFKDADFLKRLNAEIMVDRLAGEWGE